MGTVRLDSGRHHGKGSYAVSPTKYLIVWVVSDAMTMV